MDKRYSDLSDVRKIEKRRLPPIDAELRIHCPEFVAREFKVFTAGNGFKNQWGALLYLMRHLREGDVTKIGHRVITAEKRRLVDVGEVENEW